MEDEFLVVVARHVGGRIRRRRRAIDMSQERLALNAGINRTRISHYEQGLALPRLDTLILLARALGVAETQLLAGVDDDAVRRRLRRIPRSGG